MSLNLTWVAGSIGGTPREPDSLQIAAQKLYRVCAYREVRHIEKGGVECIVFDKDLL